MKHAFTKGLFVAATATLISACSTDDAADQMPVAPGKIEVSLQAALPQSRAQIEVDESNGRFSGSWEATDALTVYAKGSQTGDETPKFTYDASAKVFKGQLADAKQDWTYQAVYPAVDATPLNIPFGAERTQKGSNFNGAYDPLVSAPVTHAGAKPGKTPQGEAVTFGLSRLTAILALTFETDDATVKAEKVKSVALTAAGKTIAAKSFDITLDDQSGALNASEPSETITLSYEAGSEPTAASFKAYFNVPAATYGKLSVVITTEGHTASFDLSDKIELTAGELAYTTKAVSDWTALAAAPTMEWTENPDFAETPIEDGMQVHVKLTAPAGIKVFGITINSSTLAPIVTDPSMGFGFTVDGENSASIDLVQTPNAILMELLGLKDIDLANATEIPLDLSQLIPMIKLIGAPEGSKHIFTLKLIDKNDQPLEQALTFYIPMAAVEPSATFSDIDLWANTAKITLTDAPEGAKVAYRRLGETEWQYPTDNSNGTFTVSPSWKQSKNAAELTIHTVDRKTGIFAGATYEWQILNAEQAVIATGSYANTANPDLIENGNMEEWVDMTVDTGTVKNPKGWSSGNNDYMSFIMQGVMKNLCTASTFDGMSGNTCAKLKSQYKMTFAAGNLFTGSFVMPGNNGVGSGNANFGIPYTFTARPSGLHVKYHASVYTMDKPNETSETDIARIYVMIVDWDTPHTVVSGLKKDETTFFDPAAVNELPEGKIIGYGDLQISESTSGNAMIDVDIPIHFYDTLAVPGKEISLVIACSTSYKGDYMQGSTQNTLYVDDFEWVY